MKGHAGSAIRIVGVLIASAALALAQADEMRAADSARTAAPVGPGMVNYVEGPVTLDGEALSPQSIGSAMLKPGEALSTGPNGYAEVLLTPGAFLRVGNNSEAQLTSAGLANTTVELTQGAAMLEADQLIEGTNLSVVIDNVPTRIEKKGLYGFNAATQVVRVLNGKALVTDDSRKVTLGKHDEVSLIGRRAFKKQSFNQKAVDEEPLYVWSKARSQDEAEASEGAAMNANTYVSAGPGWYWDPYAGYYGFWPAAGFLYSPFGWGFYSPAYFGYWGGGYYGGYPNYGWHGHHGWHGHTGWHGSRLGRDECTRA